MDVLRCDIDQRGVATLTLQRPDKHNALNDILIAALTAELQRLAAFDPCRMVVLTGAGATFCSGADLAWMQASVKFDEERNRQDAQHLADLLAALHHFPKPTLAKVQGPAYGGGVGLIACCDIVIANEQALFAFSEVRLGLIPAVISPYVVSAIGARTAGKLFLTAEKFSAAQAREFGLIHECVSASELEDAVARCVESLLKAGPQAVKECKALLRTLTPATQSVDLAKWIARLRVSEEGQAGLHAFLNKQAPPWLK